MQFFKGSLIRLTLLGALASAQLTLLFRSGMAAAAIMASLSWFGGSLLLMEREEEPGVTSLERLPASRFIPGLLLLIWGLMVLSFSARLYDPLLYLVPLTTFTGLALLLGAGWSSSLTVELAFIASLLPAQVLINRFLSTGFLSVATANLSALTLWLLGRPAFAEENQVMLPNLTMVVDAACSGVNTLSLCLAASLLLCLLVPLPLPKGKGALWMVLLLATTLLISFSVNPVRVALLGLTTADPDPSWWSPLTRFDFWHSGLGSNLFSLLAMGLVCGVYVLALELTLQAYRKPGP